MFHPLTQDNFNDLLNRFSTTELEEMLSKYPYLHQAHLLLAKKYQAEKNPAFDEQLQLAALYAQDRELFFSLFNAEEVAKARPVIADTFVKEKEEEVSEIPFTEQEEPVEKTEDVVAPLVEPENHITPLIEAGTQIQTEEAQEIQEGIPATVLAYQEREEVLLSNEDSTESKISVVEKEIEHIQAEEIVKFLEPLVAELAPTQKEEKEQQPLLEMDHTFEEWLKVFSKIPEATEPTKAETAATLEPDARAAELDQLIRSNVSVNYLHELVTEETHYSRGLDDFIQEQIKKRKTHDRKMSKSENEMDPEMVTETLAKLYEAQKRYSKAIAAYEMLALKFPEKNDFFAARITDLKKMI